MKEIDHTIKEIWLNNIAKDYSNHFLLKEDSLKCCFYYHLRRKLATLLKENTLRIYPEYFFPELRYKADIAIVEIDPYCEEKHLKDRVKKVVAIIELKYDGGNSERAESWIKSDVQKIKNYIHSGIPGKQCKCYFAVIYETECEYINWLDKRSTNHWASDYVTELDAGYLDQKMTFEVHSY